MLAFLYFIAQFRNCTISKITVFSLHLLEPSPAYLEEYSGEQAYPDALLQRYSLERTNKKASFVWAAYLIHAHKWKYTESPYSRISPLMCISAARYASEACTFSSFADQSVLLIHFCRRYTKAPARKPASTALIFDRFSSFRSIEKLLAHC